MKQKTLPLRAAAICISLACLLPVLPGAQALAAAPPQAMATTSVDQAVLISPRFKYITRMSSSLTIDSNGYANCTGSYTIYDKYSGSITITLQQFINSRWTDIEEWSEDYAATDTGVHMLYKGCYVDSGYRYRAVTEVKITGADGTVIENEFCDSPTKEY